MGLYRRLEVRSRCKLFHHDAVFMMHATFRKSCSDVLQRNEKEGIIGSVSRYVLRQLSVHLLALVCETRQASCTSSQLCVILCLRSTRTVAAYLVSLSILFSISSKKCII